MANPQPRDAGRLPHGTQETCGAPDNSLIPIFTPGTLGICDSTQQSCADATAPGAGLTYTPFPMSVAKCQYLWLNKPFLVGLAIDNYLTPKVPIVVTDPGLKNSTIRFGQDVESGLGRAAPDGQSVSTSEATLKQKMRALLGIFASGDTTGMAKRLFDEFLAKKSTVTVFSDTDMDDAISKHANFLSFSERTLAVGLSPKTDRIHQALRKKKWDINKVSAITDLGVPAFNLGSKKWSTGDFHTGLGVMINGVQIVLVYVDNYFYDCDAKTYNITLRFVLYDVFGLDDDDLKEFGASSSWNVSSARQGITAWWQLQHQFGYAPLLTRSEVTRKFTNISAI